MENNATTPTNTAKVRVNHSVAVMVDILRGKGRPHFIDSDGFMIEKFRTAIQLLYSGGATCRNSAIKSGILSANILGSDRDAQHMGLYDIIWTDMIRWYYQSASDNFIRIYLNMNNNYVKKEVEFLENNSQ